MVNHTRNPHRGGNFTRGPHRGGVPKGKSWTREAHYWLKLAAKEEASSLANRRHWTLVWMKRCLETIRDHTRSSSTRTEATRLLAVLESRP